MSNNLALDGVNKKIDQPSVQKGVYGSALVTSWSNTAVYSYANRVFVPAQTIPAGGADIIVIQGSASTITDSVNGAITQRTVKIQSVMLSAESASTTGVLIPASVIRRITNSTGGTKSQLGATPHDVNDVNQSAVVSVYTANPTVGTAFGAAATPAANGILGQQFLIAASNAGTVAPAPAQWLLEQMGIKPWILRGASDFIAINLNAGIVIPTGGVYIDFEIDIEEDWSTGGG